jgi:hypothetical protein
MLWQRYCVASTTGKLNSPLSFDACEHFAFIVLAHPRQTKICNLGLHVSVQQNVAGFQVSMSKTCWTSGVQVREPLRHPKSDVVPNWPLQQDRLAP